MSQPKLNWSQVMVWRVQQHRLDERVPTRRALDVVAEIGCLHAQLMSSAELSLWARVDKINRNDVEKWLWTDRRLVKSWAMRGTLHLLKSDEYPLWQAGLGTYCLLYTSDAADDLLCVDLGGRRIIKKKKKKKEKKREKGFKDQIKNNKRITTRN